MKRQSLPKTQGKTLKSRRKQESSTRRKPQANKSQEPAARFTPFNAYTPIEAGFQMVSSQSSLRLKKQQTLSQVSKSSRSKRLQGKNVDSLDRVNEYHEHRESLPSISFNREKASQFIGHPDQVYQNSSQSFDHFSSELKFSKPINSDYHDINDAETDRDHLQNDAGEQDSTLRAANGVLDIDKVSQLDIFRNIQSIEQSSSSQARHRYNVLNTDEVDKHFLAQEQCSKVLCWGHNEAGQLGDGDFHFQVPTPFDLKLSISKVACGDSHSIFLTTDSLLYALGNNDFGQLGTESEGTFPSSSTICKQPILIESLLEQMVIDVACGDHHSVCLTQEASLESSGKNSSLERLGEKTKVIVHSWGSNSFGQLGHSNSEHKCSQPRQMKLDQLIKSRVIKVTCGARHTAMIDENGRLYQCGDNREGQVGIGSDLQSVSFPSHLKAIRDQVIQVACGNQHTIALTSNGSLFVVGSNRNGELGLGQEIRGLQEPVEMRDMKFTHLVDIRCGSFSAALSVQNQFYVWGTESFGQFYKPNRIKSFNKLAIKDFQISRGGSSYVLTHRGDVFSWGNNAQGQLGLGDLEPRTKPTKIKNLGAKVQKIFLGKNFLIALAQDQEDQQMENLRYRSMTENVSERSKSARMRENSSELISIDQMSGSQVNVFGYHPSEQKQTKNLFKGEKVLSSGKSKSARARNQKMVSSRGEAPNVLAQQQRLVSKNLHNLNDGLKKIAKFTKSKQYETEAVQQQQPQLRDPSPGYKKEANADLDGSLYNDQATTQEFSQHLADQGPDNTRSGQLRVDLQRESQQDTEAQTEQQRTHQHPYQPPSDYLQESYQQTQNSARRQTSFSKLDHYRSVQISARPLNPLQPQGISETDDQSSRFKKNSNSSSLQRHLNPSNPYLNHDSSFDLVNQANAQQPSQSRYENYCEERRHIQSRTSDPPSDFNSALLVSQALQDEQNRELTGMMSHCPRMSKSFERQDHSRLHSTGFQEDLSNPTERHVRNLSSTGGECRPGQTMVTGTSLERMEFKSNFASKRFSRPTSQDNTASKKQAFIETQKSKSGFSNPITTPDHSVGMKIEPRRFQEVAQDSINRDQRMEIDRLKKQVLDYEAKANQHKAVKDALRKRMKQTEDKFGDLTQQKDKALRATREAQVESNQFREDVVYLTRETEALLAEVKKETAMRKEAEQKLRDQEGELKSQLTTQLLKNTNLQKQFEQEKLQTSFLERELKQAQGKVANFGMEQQHIIDKNLKLEEANQTLDTKLKREKALTQELSSQVADLRTKMRDLEASKRELKTDGQGLSRQHENTKQELKREQDKNKLLLEDLNELKQALRQADKQMQQKPADYNPYRHQENSRSVPAGLDGLGGATIAGSVDSFVGQSALKHNSRQAEERQMNSTIERRISSNSHLLNQLNRENSQPRQEYARPPSNQRMVKRSLNASQIEIHGTTDSEGDTGNYESTLHHVLAGQNYLGGKNRAVLVPHENTSMSHGTKYRSNSSEVNPTYMSNLQSVPGSVHNNFLDSQNIQKEDIRVPRDYSEQLSPGKRVSRSTDSRLIAEHRDRSMHQTSDQRTHHQGGDYSYYQNHTRLERNQHTDSQLISEPNVTHRHNQGNDPDGYQYQSRNRSPYLQKRQTEFQRIQPRDSFEMGDGLLKLENVEMTNQKRVGDHSFISENSFIQRTPVVNNPHNIGHRDQLNSFAVDNHRQFMTGTVNSAVKRDSDHKVPLTPSQVDKRRNDNLSKMKETQDRIKKLFDINQKIDEIQEQEDRGRISSQKPEKPQSLVDLSRKSLSDFHKIQSDFQQRQNSQSYNQSFGAQPRFLQKINESQLEANPDVEGYSPPKRSVSAETYSTSRPPAKQLSLVLGIDKARQQHNLDDTHSRVNSQPPAQNYAQRKQKEREENRISFPNYPQISQKVEAPYQQASKSTGRQENTSRSSQLSRAVDFNTLIRQRYEQERCSRERVEDQPRESSHHYQLQPSASGVTTKMVRESLADLKSKLKDMRVERKSNKELREDLYERPQYERDPTASRGMLTYFDNYQ